MILTTVGPALVWTGLIFVGDVCTSVLVQVAGVKVPAGRSGETNVSKQTTCALTAGHAWDELGWPATLCSRAKVALLLRVCEDRQSGQCE